MSKLREFFLVSLPGLEDLVDAEVAAWFPQLKREPMYAGLTVMAPLAEGLAMNLVLKTPTRILLRVTRFRVKDFPKLYAKVTDFEWSEWVDPSAEVEIVAATKQSRLKIKSRIEDTCRAAWRDHQKDRGIKPNPKKQVKLFVRIADDECTLSLDTSGERLHKRGAREHVGEAPLRETIAAALIRMTAANAKVPGQDVEIVDPMAGSGTFLIEAAGLTDIINAREFGFEVFREGASQVQAPPEPIFKMISGVGYEQDAKTLKAAKHNMRRSNSMEIREQDFFEAEPLPESATPRWVFCNPPYGERLKVDQPLDQYYANLFATVEKIARPELACFLLPAKAVKGKFLLPYKWKALEKRKLLNGGIPVVAFVFGRNQ